MDLLHLSQRLRELRTAQGMTLEQLAAKSSLSKGFLSQVENFRVTPSLKALDRLAAALGVTMTDLFQPCGAAPEYSFGSLDAGEELTRDDNLRYGLRYFALAYKQIGRRMDPFLVEYRPSGLMRDFALHDTEEFYLVLEGSVDFYLNKEKTCRVMKKGDTLYMKPNLPHRAVLHAGCLYAKALILYSKPE